MRDRERKGGRDGGREGGRKEKEFFFCSKPPP